MENTDNEFALLPTMFAFTWLITQGIWIFLDYKFHFHVHWYFGLLVSTALGFVVVAIEKHFAKK
jgi:hypothetical protein